MDIKERCIIIDRTIDGILPLCESSHSFPHVHAHPPFIGDLFNRQPLYMPNINPPLYEMTKKEKIQYILEQYNNHDPVCQKPLTHNYKMFWTYKPPVPQPVPNGEFHNQMFPPRMKPI